MPTTTENLEIDRIRAEFAELSLEADALRREVDAQMQSKLDAQSLLANLAQALGFERSDFDFSDTWGTVGPRLVGRLAEIVKEAEAARFPVETVFAWKERAEAAEARCRDFEETLDRENAAWWISHNGKRRLRLVRRSRHE